MRSTMFLAGAAMAAVVTASAVAAPPPPSPEKARALIEATQANQNLKPTPAPKGGWPANTPYAITMKGLTGGEVPMSAFSGKVVLLVNTASKCGYTPQYEGLEALYEKRKGEGLVVLGVPSSDFMGQELATGAEIAEFCQLNFGVTFPMAEKDHVKGKEASAVYKWAEAQLGKDAVPKWNFHKVLIGRDGKAIAAFPTATKPDAPEVTKAIEAALKR